MSTTSELHGHPIDDDPALGLDRHANLPVVFFPKQADDFGIFEQQKKIQKRLSVVGGSLMFFAEIQAHLEPRDLPAQTDANVLEHVPEKLEMGDLFRRIDVLIDLFGIHAELDHLGSD